MKVIGTRAGSKGTFPVDTIDVRSMTRLSTNVRASSGYHGRLINSADNRSKQTHGFESNTADPWPIVFTLTRTSHTLLSLKLFLIRLRQIRNSSIERNFSRLYRFIYIYIFLFFFFYLGSLICFRWIHLLFFDTKLFASYFISSPKYYVIQD